MEQRLGELAAAAGFDPQTVGEELFAVVALLNAEHGVRRTLVDTTRPAQARAEMVASLFDGRVSAPSVELLKTAVAHRWTRGHDLTDTLERCGVIVTLDAAERAGAGEDVEDELFRFARLVDGNPGLRRALSDESAPAESKNALLDQLLGSRATAVTGRLVAEAVTQARGRSIEATIEGYARTAAERRRQLVAHVVSAVALTDEQRTRLAGALSRQYGTAIHLDVQVDPTMAGGIKVQLGDEVIDGTIDTRLAEARRRLAG